MIALNDKGTWGRIKKILPNALRSQDENVTQIWTAAAGAVVFKSVNTNVTFAGNQHLESEIVNNMLGQLNKETGLFGEFYGVTYFEMPNPEESWVLSVRNFMADPSSFNMLHPRLMKADKPYLFFARRFVQSRQTRSRGVDA